MLVQACAFAVTFTKSLFIVEQKGRKWVRGWLSVCVCEFTPVKEMSQSHCHTVEAGWHLNIWKYPICKRPRDLRYEQAAEPWCWIKNAKDTIWPLSYLQDFRKTPTIFKVKLPNTCIIKSQHNVLASVHVYRVQRCQWSSNLYQCFVHSQMIVPESLWEIIGWGKQRAPAADEHSLTHSTGIQPHCRIFCYLQ